MARLRAAAWLAALALFAAGCGDRTLWQRWRAERALFHARVLDLRVRAAGSSASPAELEHVRRAYLRVAAAFPPARWVPGAARGDTLARDIARVSAAASTRAAELDAALGRAEPAQRELDAVASAYRGVWPSAFEARLASARLLEAAGDSATALGAWEQAARLGAVVDPDSARVCERTFVAARRVAGAHRAAGRMASADSLWGAMTSAVDAALRAHTGDSLAPALWLKRGETTLARGGSAGFAAAEDAYRHALAAPAGAPFAFEAMLGLGEAALAAGGRDSAVAWARRAAAIAAPPDLARATDLETRSWEAAGRLDSAAVALDRLADTRHLPLGVPTVARFQEGLLYERLGNWDLARSAYHTVIASDPLHPAAFDAMERLVLHHVEHREPGLAEQEARWGLDQMERTLDTVRDPDVRIRAWQVKARLLRWVGDDAGSLEAWDALWREHPDRPEGVAAGFEAASLAADLKERARAVNLYADLSRRAPRMATRDSARRAAAALGNPGR